MTSYRLTFLRDAKKEWDKLGATIRSQFAAKLRERLQDPRVPAARLASLKDCYKIKLRSAAYRLVYRVIDDRLVVQVIAVGKRERSEVYRSAAKRISD
ncbi:MAG TPA: type II toxin-antitoxin system RelE/ParE family toxin [Sphingomicrobium sp.]|nr:type II toxin-antitoxin system RelE/ParE family toxin [Sphingomicrobium sp.]